MLELAALADRCDQAMLLAIRQHYKLGHGFARDRALSDAANYAAVAAALRTSAVSEGEGK
jgi:hypothetical protein